MIGLGYADARAGLRESSRPLPTQGALQINARFTDDTMSRRIARSNAGYEVVAGCKNTGVVRNVVEMQIPVFSLAPTNGASGAPHDVWSDWSLMPAVDKPIFEGFAATNSSPDDRHPDSIAITVNGILQIKNTGDRPINDGEVVIWTYPYTAHVDGRWRSVNAPPTLIGIAAGVRGLRTSDFTLIGLEQLAKYDKEAELLLRSVRANAGTDSFDSGWESCQLLYNFFQSRTIGVARMGGEPGAEVYLELRSLGFMSQDVFDFQF